MGMPTDQATSLRSAMGLLSQDDLASLLDVKVQTLRQWRRLGRGPDFVRAQKSVYYRRTDVEKWISLNVVPTNRTADVSSDLPTPLLRG